MTAAMIRRTLNASGLRIWASPMARMPETAISQMTVARQPVNRCVGPMGAAT